MLGGGDEGMWGSMGGVGVSDGEEGGEGGGVHHHCPRRPPPSQVATQPPPPPTPRQEAKVFLQVVRRD